MTGRTTDIKRNLVAAALLVIPFVALFVWWLSTVIWLPDLISPDATHVIGQCKLGNGETVKLTQRWVGDGYLTAVQHDLANGDALFVVGDGDAARAFSCRAKAKTNDGFVVFQFSGREWHYYWGEPRGGQFLVRDDGQIRGAL